jgi:prepilin signal peptidase PulO-like enzyme (type II secretory pathway)
MAPASWPLQRLRNAIGVRYPMVELLAGLLSASLAVAFGPTLQLAPH